MTKLQQTKMKILLGFVFRLVLLVTAMYGVAYAAWLSPTNHVARVVSVHVAP